MSLEIPLPKDFYIKTFFQFVKINIPRCKYLIKTLTQSISSRYVDELILNKDRAVNIFTSLFPVDCYNVNS